MKLPDLLPLFAARLANHNNADALDEPVESDRARKMRTTGALHLYAMDVPPGTMLLEDVPVTIVPPGDLAPTGGYLLQHRDRAAVVQTLDALEPSVVDHALVADTPAFFNLAATRLADMAARPESYALGPAERLAPWLDPEPGDDTDAARAGASAAVLTTVWHEDQAARWTTLGELAVALMRRNKRVLVVAPAHDAVDRLLGFLAKTLRNAALPFQSLLSRYELSVLEEAEGCALGALSFEWQMDHFFARSRSRKNALQQQYNRFRELTPILARKGQTQRDVNEVKLLEWRLLAHVSAWQGKIAEIDTMRAAYRQLPVWKRLGMQAMGKNEDTLEDYRTLHEARILELMKEVETAQTRIRALAPGAAVSKEMLLEYEALKDEIVRLGGAKKVRELLAAGEATNRQAFMQNKRLVAATPGRLVTDPLFQRIRFDVLIADDAPNIPAPLLLGVAGLIRERIIIAGDTRDLQGPAKLWRQHCLATEPAPSGGASSGPTAFSS